MNDDLMARAMRGDRDAFGRVVKQHQQRLLRFACRMVGDREAAADIVQEAFIRVWQSRTGYRALGLSEAYLLRVVRNGCIDHVRAAGRWTHAPIDDDLPTDTESCDHLVCAGALRDTLGQALMLLPEWQRAVFVLSEYEGLSYREIAQALGCPVGTVASRKYAAVEALRKTLRPWLEGEPDDRM